MIQIPLILAMSITKMTQKMPVVKSTCSMNVYLLGMLLLVCRMAAQEHCYMCTWMA